MANKIEIVSFPQFNVCERRLLRDLKTLNLGVNGAIVNADIKYELFKTNDKNEIVEDDKKIKYIYTDILSASINLGKYLYEKNDIFSDFAYCYVKFTYINYLHRQNIHTPIQYADIIQKIKEPKPIRLIKTFDNLDVNKFNNIEFDDLKVKIPKYIKDKKLNKLLFNWLNHGGILEKYVPDVEEMKIISMDYILEIFDLCLTAFNLYLKIQNNTISPVELTYKTTNIPIINRGKINIEKQIPDILSLLKFMLITHVNDEFKHLRECEYCHSLFFGRPNKKCCSGSCKDYKNNKSKKRKIKRQQQREEIKRSDRICC